MRRNNDRASARTRTRAADSQTDRRLTSMRSSASSKPARAQTPMPLPATDIEIFCAPYSDRLFRLQKPDINRADHVRQREQHKRHRRCITKIKKPKRRAVDVKTDRFGREPWSTFRKYE